MRPEDRLALQQDVAQNRSLIELRIFRAVQESHWLQRHSEFERHLLPELRRRIAKILAR